MLEDLHERHDDAESTDNKTVKETTALVLKLQFYGSYLMCKSMTIGQTIYSTHIVPEEQGTVTNDPMSEKICWSREVHSLHKMFKSACD